MIIPVKCYTCGKCLSDKYEYYDKELERRKKELEIKAIQNNTKIIDPLLINIKDDVIKKTIAGEIMDELGLIRICCRKILLTSINIIDEI